MIGTVPSIVAAKVFALLDSEGMFLSRDCCSSSISKFVFPICFEKLARASVSKIPHNRPTTKGNKVLGGPASGSKNTGKPCLRNCFSRVPPLVIASILVIFFWPISIPEITSSVSPEWLDEITKVSLPTQPGRS